MTELTAGLAALRERGAARVDPVRWCLVEAMARRAQAHEGPARQLLDARLQALLADFDSALATQAQPATATGPAQAVRSPLADLSEHLAQHATPPGTELKTLAYFRRTWSRINVGQRMTQSLAREPENAGPINSHGLVLRALKQVREISPDHLARYVSYVDALLALDQLSGGAALLHRDVLRSEQLAAAAAPPAAPTKPRPRTRRKP